MLDLDSQGPTGFVVGHLSSRVTVRAARTNDSPAWKCDYNAMISKDLPRLLAFRSGTEVAPRFEFPARGRNSQGGGIMERYDYGYRRGGGYWNGDWSRPAPPEMRGGSRR